MKRFIAGALILASLAAGFAGCSRKPDAGALRERVTNYEQLVAGKRFDDAMVLCDPDIVARKGHSTIKGLMQTGGSLIGGLNLLTGRKPAGFEIRSVDVIVENGKESALVRVAHFTTNESGQAREETLTTQKWIQRNGVWFLEW